MKRLLPDRLLVKMPCSRELQIGAMTVVQEFINTYVRRMEANTHPDWGMEYKLEWEMVGLSAADWEMWRKVGLHLEFEPGDLAGPPDIVLEFTDARLRAFEFRGKHITQVCGSMCGIMAWPFPKIRTVQPRVEDPRWACLMGDFRGEQLFEMKDGEWTGVIGLAGWETYLAASMGLGVIEILPSGKSLTFVSKWPNKLYRVVVDTMCTKPLIAAAKKSVEEMLCSLPAVALPS